MTTSCQYRFLAAAVAALTLAPPAAAQARPAARDAAEARAIIAEGYRAWGEARVALDRETLERMLAPDFVVRFPGMTASRDEFMAQISASRPGMRLVRFDADVLTLEPTSDGWSTVIREKLESERTLPDGTSTRGYSLWITRDGWRVTDGTWQLTSSEVIGVEMWQGEPPPFDDWDV